MALLLLCGALSACDRQSASGEQANAAGAVTADEVAPDEVRDTGGNSGESFSFAIDRSKAGTAAPDLPFIAPDGMKTSLKAFIGKPLLINLWATWCAPCVAEMPTLDKVAGTYADRGLQVLTISQDSRGATLVDPFFAKRDFAHLRPWLDPDNEFGFHYGTGQLPTSILYDRDGKEVARVVGAMDWEGKDAEALIGEALKGG